LLFNTATGIWSSTSCSGGTGYNCSGGTLTFAPLGVSNIFTTGNCPFMIHNMKGSSTNDYPVVAVQGSLAPPGCNNFALVLQPFHAFNAATSTQSVIGKLGHWAVGATHMNNIGQIGTTFGFSFGEYDNIIDLTHPNLLANVLLSWQVDPCSSSWVGDGTDANPPCLFSAAYDEHLSWGYNPGDTDTSPVCGSMYNDSGNIGLLGLPLIVAPFQGEEVCISDSPTWIGSSSSAPVPNSGQRQYRFTHTFNTETNAFFDTQFAVSQLSHDGRYLAFSSDWDCTLGDTSGNPTSLCGLPWQANHAYTVNTLISPIGGLSGTGALYDVFKITTPGTSGTSFPGFANPNLAWASCTGTVGCTVTDSNGVVYTDQGKSNGKGEVFVVELAR